MKLQALNGSLARVLAASAVAFMVATASAQAQQGLWGADGCFYAAVFSAAPSGALQGSMQMVRQGCAVQSPDGQARYYDLKTGQLFVMGNNPSQQGSKVGKIFKSLVASHKQVLQALQARRADPAATDPQAMQQAAYSATMVPQAMQQGANSVPMIPQAMQQAAYSTTMVPQAMQQAANSVPMIPQAMQQAAYSTTMVPQAMQQAANSVPMIPQAMQQAAYSTTMVPQAMQQGANPYFEAPYAVGGGAPVMSAQGTCGVDQPNCLQAGGPNAPAGNLGLSSNGPAPAIKPQGKQTRTKASKARTAPSCAESYAGCQ